MATPRAGHRGRGRGESPTSPRRLEAKERTAAAVKLRKQGASYQEIADALGYADRSAAHQAVMAAIADIVAEPARDLLVVEVARLDELQAAVWPAATQGDLFAIDRALKLSERRAKLLGLDAAEKREISGPNGGPITISASVEVDAVVEHLVTAGIDLHALYQEAMRRWFASLSDGELEAERERIRLVKWAAERSAVDDDDPYPANALPARRCQPS